MLRRDFLKLMATGVTALSPNVMAGDYNIGSRKPLPMTQFRALELRRGNSTLRLDIGNSQGYMAACYLLRDVLANQSAKAHPWLLHTASLLQALAARSYAHESLIITSGFRTLSTNQAAGGAKHSYHMANPRGFFHAMDVHMKSVPINVLFKLALDINQGGAGIYNNKGFVHIDVGPPRSWSDV